jgi:hypothetical protein
VRVGRLLRKIGVAVALCALVVLPRAINLGTFIAFDEPYYWEWSNQFTAALLRGDWRGTLLDARPSVLIMWVQALGLGVKYLLSGLLSHRLDDIFHLLELERPLIPSLLGEKRLYMGLANSAAILFLYWSVRRLLGSRVALVALVLLALDPLLLADSRTMRGDALMSTLMCLSAIWFFFYLKEKHRSSLLLSGGFAGLALLIKTTSIIILAFILPALALDLMRKPAGMGRRVLAIVLWVAVTAGAFWTLWPALWIAPGDAFDKMLKFAGETGIGGRSNYFMGSIYHDEPLPLYYIFDLLLLTTPLSLFGFGAILYRCGSVTYHSWQRGGISGWWKEYLADGSRPPVAVLALLGYVLAIWIGVTVGTLKRPHYLMPAFPAIDALGAAGLVWLGGMAWNCWLRPLLNSRYARRDAVNHGDGVEAFPAPPAGVPPAGGRTGAGMVSHAPGVVGLCAVLLLQGAVVLPHHPYYYTYWNPILLDGRFVSWATMVGWGPDLGAAADYLNAKPDADRLVVAEASGAEFTPLFRGRRVYIDSSGAWAQADYVMIRIYHLQFQKHSPAFLAYLRRQPPEHVVNLHGIDYIWIYRGPAVQHYARGAALAGKAMLLGYNLTPEMPASGGELAVWLLWQNRGERDDEMYIRLVDAGGLEWARGEFRPMSGFERAARTDEAFVESEARVEIPVGTPPSRYYLKMGLFSPQRKETIGEFTLPAGDDSVEIQRSFPAVSTEELPVPQQVRARLGDVELVGYQFATEQVRREGEWWLTLYWRAIKDVGADYVVAIRLLDAHGKEAEYWLGRPVMSGYPTTEWVAGEVVKDRWKLKLREDMAAGTYRLEVEAIDSATGQSLGRASLGEVKVHD